MPALTKPVMFDTPEQIKKHADRILFRAVQTKTMPQANKTNITEEERELLTSFWDVKCELVRVLVRHYQELRSVRPSLEPWPMAQFIREHCTEERSTVIAVRRLRDPEDHVRLLVELVARHDRRTRLGEGRVREEGTLTGALLHEDLEPGRRELAERFGYQGDPPLSGRGLLGDADLHWHHLVGGIAIRAKG